MLARVGGVTAKLDTGFHLQSFIHKDDAEWLRLYNQMYVALNLACTQCLPEPVALAALVMDDGSEEWTRDTFPQG